MWERLSYVLLLRRSVNQARERSRAINVVPFQSTSDILNQIDNLPAISHVGFSFRAKEWEAYVSLAKRLRVSRLDLISSALRELPEGQLHSFDLEEKVMILLRVCFECPKGTKRPVTYGGWLYDPPAGQSQAALDANWPVGREFGRFFLVTYLNGYLGRPYDPVADLSWLLSHGRWREL